MTNKKTNITKQELKILITVVIFALCGMLGLDIHLASMPHIMKYMHTDKAHMQQSVSLFILGLGCSLLFYGPLSDKYGRKPIVIFGLLFASLFSFIAADTKTIHAFLLTRFFQGVGSGVCSGLGRTIVVDILQGERMAIIGSYFGMFLMLSPLFAPALGGYIQHWLGWQANFITLGSLLLIACLIFAAICPETNLHKNKNACHPVFVIKNYLSLLSHPLFVGCTLMTGIGMAANMVYPTISSFLFQIHFRLSPVTYGWLTALVSIGGLVGKFISPSIIKRFGSVRTLLAGFSIILTAGFLITFFALLNLSSAAIILIAVFLVLCGQSFINPVSTSKALSSFHERRGAAGALYGSFQMLIAFVTSAIVGGLSHDGIGLMAISYGLLGLLGIAVLLLISAHIKKG